MATDLELDRLTQLLRQCLGRIDEAAFHCQSDGSAVEHEASVEQLGAETDTLQELVTSLVDVAARAPEQAVADLNQIVHRAVQQVLHRSDAPVVLRSRLGGGLPLVACRPGKVAHAVQRALQLAVGHAGHGGRVELATRQEDGQVVFELQAEGHGDPGVPPRAATLAEFVAGCGGRCRVARDEVGELLLLLELPTADVLDDRLGE